VSWREIAPELVKDVAAGLGLGWVADPEVTDWQAWVNGPGEQRLLLCPPDSRDNPQRVQVQTSFSWSPSSYARTPDSRYITCALSRGGEDIARDIARKLLPGYLEELSLYRRRVEQFEANENRRQVMLLRYERLVPGSQIIEHSQSVYLGIKKTGHGEIRPSHDGYKATVKLDMIPTDLAEQVLHTVATWIAAHEEAAAT
jgi:hypothetical protein